MIYVTSILTIQQATFCRFGSQLFKRTCRSWIGLSSTHHNLREPKENTNHDGIGFKMLEN